MQEVLWIPTLYLIVFLVFVFGLVNKTFFFKEVDLIRRSIARLIANLSRLDFSRAKSTILWWIGKRGGVVKVKIYVVDINIAFQVNRKWLNFNALNINRALGRQQSIWMLRVTLKTVLYVDKKVPNFLHVDLENVLPFCRP